jgi:hypothetical protein
MVNRTAGRRSKTPGTGLCREKRARPLSPTAQLVIVPPLRLVAVDMAAGNVVASFLLSAWKMNPSSPKRRVDRQLAADEDKKAERNADALGSGCCNRLYMTLPIEQGGTQQ